MTMLYNAKPANLNKYDSFYMYDTNYVSSNNRASVSIYPAAYFMDVNNDGKRDLIYAPNSVSTQYIIEETKQIRWFKNTNTDKSPTWAQQEPLFTNDILDNGNKSNWACADWDKDGDLDIFPTNYANNDTKEIITYYWENINGKLTKRQWK